MAQIKDNLVGIDVGGTFTDLICFDSKSKSYNFTKVFTSAKNQSQGVLNAIDKASINLKKQDLIIHGTTTTTNALLERKISKFVCKNWRVEAILLKFCLASRGLPENFV